MSQLAALILSIAVEAIVAFALIRTLRWGNGINAALAASLGTLVTHPIVWFIIPKLEGLVGYAEAVTLAETGVIIAESIAYRLLVPLIWRRALIASFAANAASTAAGLLYYALFT